MKLSLDPKFLGTALLVSVVLILVFILVNAVAGIATASVVGALVAALAVKLFDKLDYNPSEEIHFGAPLVSVPWLYSAAASIFLLYGTRLLADMLVDATSQSIPGSICGTTFLVSLIAAAWSGFAIGGWLIGRIFPQRAIGLASLAFAILFFEWWLDMRGMSPDKLGRVQACLYGASEAANSPMQRTEFVSTAAVGVVFQGLLAITAARIASRKPQARG